MPDLKEFLALAASSKTSAVIEEMHPLLSLLTPATKQRGELIELAEANIKARAGLRALMRYEMLAVDEESERLQRAFVLGMLFERDPLAVLQLKQIATALHDARVVIGEENV